MGVVKLLEVVKVDHQQAQRSFGSALLGAGQGPCLLKLMALVQAGQRTGCRQCEQACLSVGDFSAEQGYSLTLPNRCKKTIGLVPVRPQAQVALAALTPEA